MTEIIEWFREKEKQLSRSKYKRPFGEWRMPVMIVSISSIFFVLLTAMFGVTINRNTGALQYNMDGLQAVANDPWVNPMGQFPGWCYFAMIIGYYVAVGFLVIGWFDYCKWKWNNIPMELRYEEKKMQIR